MKTHLDEEPQQRDGSANNCELVRERSDRTSE